MADAIQIGAPDGSIVEFPPGTSDDIIKTAMAKAYPPPTAAPAAAAAPGNGILGTIDDYVRAAANGMTFGLADRFAAGMGSATGIGGKSGDYAGNLQSEQGKTDQFATDHPIGSIAANVAGGAVVPIGAIGAAAKGASLGAKTLYGMGAGAGLGGLQGALGSRDLTDLPTVAADAGKGAVLGGTVGAVLPGAGKVLGSGYNAIADALTARAAGLSRAATGHLTSAVGADGLPAVQARLAQLGPDATLADAGPALLGKAQGAALNSDEGRSVLQTALTHRNEGTNQRIMGDVNSALGPAEDPQLVTDAIRAHRSAVDNVSYPTALGNAPDVDVSELMGHIDTAIKGTPSGTMERRALENMRNMLTTAPERETASVPAAAIVDQHARDVADIRAKFGDAAAQAFDKQQRGSAAPGPSSLLEFIASKGGLGPDSELEAIGAHTHNVNIEGVGRRRLVKQGGLPLDYAREAAEEAGYLHGDHNGTSSVNDLLDAIDAEMRGQKRYPAGFEGTVTRREAAARSEREQYEYDRHVQGLEEDLAASHGGQSSDVRQRAAQLMADQGLDANTAIERAAKQADATAIPAAEKSVPHTDAAILHKVKQELDNVIEYNAPGLGVPAAALQNQQGSLKYLRGHLNKTLEDQVPGYASANRVSAALAQRAQAVERGTQYLGSGKTTPSPDRFAAEFSQLTPGEQIAFAKGSRGNIERVLGTKANDLQALRGELQGEGGWNTAKLATVHGQDAADALTSTVDRNLKFRDTYNKVVENSQTAQRNAAAKAMKPEPASDIPLFGPSSTLTGMGVTAAKKAAVGIANALLQKDPTASYGEVARVLAAQGGARDAHLQAIADALVRRQSNAAASPVVGDRAALIAAILGNAYAQSGPRRRQEQ